MSSPLSLPKSFQYQHLIDNFYLHAIILYWQIYKFLISHTKELYDALWLDLEFILNFCASGCNFVYETSEIRHSFNPGMSKETMTQVNISGR